VDIREVREEYISDFPERTKELMLANPTWVFFRENKRVGLLSIITIWPRKGWGWIRGDMTPRELLELSKIIKEKMPTLGFRRIEILVDLHLDKWAERCGFEREALCRKAMEDGSDGYLYAWVEHGSTA